jgi:peptidoglycan hydrolase CwlO-like protein
LPKGGVGVDENALLSKLADSFDDMKERLIRIEENVKNINSIKEDVEHLKVKLAEEDARSKSAHKRIDTLEASAKERENDIKWLKRQITIGFITFVFTVLAGVILFAATK